MKHLGTILALSKKPYKGTRDFYPKDKRVLDYLFSKMKSTAESFAYEAYDGPMLEEVELYRAKSGDELINEQIYSFHDRGERFVAIRPEMTPTVARMVAGVHKETQKPIRWFSIPNLYRYERPQKGRLREHWQFNVDIFGAPENLGEVEVLNLAVDLMRSFRATKDMFEIQLNDRRIINHVFNELLKLDNEQSYKLYKIVDKKKKVSSEAFQKMLAELNFTTEQQSFFDEYLQCTTLPLIYSFLSRQGADDLANKLRRFHDLLRAAGIDEFIVFDPTIVRGLDYYTGVVFEIFDKHPDNRRAICGGGSYANLLQIFNETPLAGVGLGLGDVTLRDFLETHDLLPQNILEKNIDLFLTTQSDKGIDTLLSVANTIRSLGVKVQVELSPIKYKKVFSQAEKFGAIFVGLIDEQELSDGTVQIRNLRSKKTETIKINELTNLRDLL